MKLLVIGFMIGTIVGVVISLLLLHAFLKGYEIGSKVQK